LYEEYDMNTCPAALDIAIALTALQFNKHDRKAAALLVPYLAWCAFIPTSLRWPASTVLSPLALCGGQASVLRFAQRWHTESLCPCVALDSTLGRCYLDACLPDDWCSDPEAGLFSAGQHTPPP
jgi:TspO/MBR family